jgi:hypothetical protein
VGSLDVWSYERWTSKFATLPRKLDAVPLPRRKIARAEPRAVYVLDEHDHLLGTIYDGDMARTIFEHIEPSNFMLSLNAEICQKIQEVGRDLFAKSDDR